MDRLTFLNLLSDPGPLHGSSMIHSPVDPVAGRSPTSRLISHACWEGLSSRVKVGHSRVVQERGRGASNGGKSSGQRAGGIRVRMRQVTGGGRSLREAGRKESSGKRGRSKRSGGRRRGGGRSWAGGTTVAPWRDSTV